jgi:hypothetical protein
MSIAAARYTAIFVDVTTEGLTYLFIVQTRKLKDL